MNLWGLRAACSGLSPCRPKTSGPQSGQAQGAAESGGRSSLPRTSGGRTAVRTLTSFLTSHVRKGEEAFLRLSAATSAITGSSGPRTLTQEGRGQRTHSCRPQRMAQRCHGEKVKSGLRGDPISRPRFPQKERARWNQSVPPQKDEDRGQAGQITSNREGAVPVPEGSSWERALGGPEGGRPPLVSPRPRPVRPACSRNVPDGANPVHAPSSGHTRCAL